jgi:RNA polymerase sigma factor (sigma-70 family)
MADSEAILLARYAQSRDANAFRALFEVHQHMVYAVCHRVLGNREDAEDAAQSCFFQLALKAAKLKAPVAGWLHKVAVNVSVDMLRQRSSRAARAAKAQELRPQPAEPSWEEIRGCVDEAIAELPEDLRAPVVLYYLEGRKQGEVAEELGITQPAVSGRIERGVSALRKRLAKAGFMAGIVGPAGVAALAAMLSTNAAEAAPPALSAALGKMALAGVGAGAVGAGTGAAGAAGATKVILLVFAACAVIVVGAVTLLGVLLTKAAIRARSERESAATVVTAARSISEGSAAGPSGPARLGPAVATGAEPASVAALAGGETVLNADNAGTNMFLDLDAGRLLSIPQDVAELDRMVGWMRAQGADILYARSMEARAVIAADMVVVPTDASAWDDATFEGVAGVLGGVPARPAFPEILKPDAGLPATFLFRTREGAMGVFQILGFDERGGTGAHTRYRLLLP